MIFINNKYTRVYYSIISRAKSRSSSGYTETHHIIPRSLGGTDSKDNLVKLTAREHYICHLLLPKMLEGENKYKMLCAILRMAHSNQKQRITIPSRIYEKVKIEKAKLHSELFSDKNNPFYGKKHSEETKQKLREARARQVDRQGDTMSEEARKKLSQAAKGRIFSDEHKNKISSSLKETYKNPALRAAISNRRKGNSLSTETKIKLAEACRKKAKKTPKPEITCPHCGKRGGEPSMKRWHFDRCRLNTSMETNKTC